MTGRDDTQARTSDTSQPLENLHPNERIKAESNFLRGTITTELDDLLTYGISENDAKILKFFGIYQQDDRDIRDERRRQKLEPAYQFMVRLRLPGGILSSEQWLKLDEIAHRYANGALRITDRQTIQFHGVLKPDLKSLIQALGETGIDTIAACGDDTRGVMVSPAPHLPDLWKEVYELASRLSSHLRPRTSAYSEIWLNDTATGVDEEPLYGPTYLPRKFKIAFAIPPSNDVDVYTPDLGFIAILDSEKLCGFNVVVGGGMGRTDNVQATYPRLGDVIGFVTPEQVILLAETVISIQRDFGNRVDRSRARFKYTIDEFGLEWFIDQLETRLGRSLDEPRPYKLETNADRFGWQKGSDELWHFILFVPNGRIKDDQIQLMSMLRDIAQSHDVGFCLTPNQNVMITRVDANKKGRIDRLLADYRFHGANRSSVLQRTAISCVAFPTCGLAMAESERYLPTLIEKIESILAGVGLEDQPISIRMSGCPNGCSRPYIAEIGFSGRAPGKYNVYLGGGDHGQRLNKLFLENVNEDRILAELTPIFEHYANVRRPNECFGDFVIRAGYVDEVKQGRFFND